MGVFSKIFLVAAFLLTYTIIKNFNDMTKPLPIPNLDLKRYWGPGSAANYKEDTKIKPFKIAYTKEVSSRCLRNGDYDYICRRAFVRFQLAAFFFGALLYKVYLSR